jgi:hypothetical protein
MEWHVKCNFINKIASRAYRVEKLKNAREAFFSFSLRGGDAES